MTTLLLLIPDGFGVRNFVLGKFLKLAAQAGTVSILHNAPESVLAEYSAGLEGRLRWHRLLPHHDSPIPFTLRYSLAYAHMRWADTRAMRTQLARPLNEAIKGSARTKLAHRVARVIGEVAATPGGVQTLNRLYVQAEGRLPKVNHYRSLFLEERPSVLFCSNQWMPAIMAPVLAAQSLDIPTATFIFSWDNLTTKGRIAAPFDHYLVWSDHMRGELLRYYPDVTADRVHVIGTPQFDPYCDQSLIWPRDEFFRRLGADPARPLICFSGGIAGTCPDDPVHIGLLLEQIRSGQIKGHPQVVLRPAPTDDPARYDAIRQKFPELIYSAPSWEYPPNQSHNKGVPKPEDIDLMANLTQYTDLNVNMASTMTIDFAIHDKPVVNLAFDMTDPPPFGKSLWDYYYQFDHYRPVSELGAARIAHSADDLAEHINAYLSDPSLDREGRRRLVELEVSLPLGNSSSQIMNVLQKVAQ